MDLFGYVKKIGENKYRAFIKSYGFHDEDEEPLEAIADVELDENDRNYIEQKAGNVLFLSEDQIHFILGNHE